MPPALSQLPTEESGLFDTVAGLPVHPLVVHAAVVLMPLSILGLLLILLVRKLRPRYASLVTLGTIVGAIALFVTEQSGEALRERVSVSNDHAEMGELAAKIGLGVAVLTAIWYVLQRSSRRRALADGTTRDTLGATISGTLAGLAGIAAVTTIVLAGHSGAESAWADAVATPSTGTSTSTPSSTASATTSATGAAAGTTATSGSTSAGATSTSSAASGYTLAAVKQHNSADSCWTVIDGQVYDLTQWIGQHPGGKKPIEGLCGIDGTSAFTAQHGGERRPAGELSTFRLGALAG